MDEPTSALSDEEINTLFTIIGNLKEKEISCIFISHKINEVLKISDTITVLRDAGYKTTLVIDGPMWGQDIEPIRKYSSELLESDPLKNLLFSVHMYYYWNDANKIASELEKTRSMNLPLIVGEFGYNFDKGFNNLECKVDHTVILSKCNELGIGYLPWSWTGNNKDNAWLDVAEFRGKDALTWWGRQVIESEAGIRKNAAKASVFSE